MLPKRRPVRWLLSVDPGLSGTGAAFWKAGKLQAVHLLRTPHRQKSQPAWERAYQIALEVYELFSNAEDAAWNYEAILEAPAFYQSAGGRMTAARGDLVKLTCCASCIYSLLRLRGVPEVSLVSASAWRGQLPQRVLEERIAAQLPRFLEADATVKPRTEHEWDAIGIGLWYLYKSI